MASATLSQALPPNAPMAYQHRLVTLLEMGFDCANLQFFPLFYYFLSLTDDGKQPFVKENMHSPFLRAGYNQLEKLANWQVAEVPLSETFNVVLCHFGWC